jgi:excisionase family DNA binding protein
MLTVPEAARRVGRDPETVRRWIRSGKLRSQKVGTQHLIQEDDLAPFEHAVAGEHWIPEEWRTFHDGRPQPDWERLVRRTRGSH